MSKANDVNALVMRCLITGNPCGTDTWPIGSPCQCENCRKLTNPYLKGSDEWQAWDHGYSEGNRAQKRPNEHSLENRMKPLIKEITSVTNEGVSFKLTEKAKLNAGMSADQWYVSWDKIGVALFGEQYSDAESVKELKLERGEI